MKKLLLITAYCMIYSFTNAQAIEYGYDNAGNRVLRQVYVMRPASSQKSAAPEASDALEDKAGEFEFVLFPNPTKDVLNISVNDLFLEEENKEVTVLDLNGKVLAKQKVEGRVTNLDFSSYTPGPYIVRMTTKGKQVREWKIVRE
ncbi:T9SS type A sorting domain-containing protein [uncultured Fluviicola sp.]|uniref:T9SS type A sorting domain-containing protein n=1 Tax=uncultured Fluviicola sp. TaxID=463303 RepID=UPI0025F2F5B4|nr:T9SS type A sorting domain-containing protein [uncultured Fluviicola sp.]